MTTTAIESAFAPDAPRTLEDTGLNFELVTQLVLKTLDAAGELTATSIAEQTGLTCSAIAPSLDALKAQRLCEIVGTRGTGSLAFVYRMTSLGRERAAEYLRRNRYVGIAPVPLDQYRAYMASFKAQRREHRVSPERIRQAFAHLVLRDSVVDQLGTALNSGRSLFVYGPPGNGKTVVSQAIGNLLAEDMWIPHALEVRGSLIQVFDPINHQARPVEESRWLMEEVEFDRRWIRCRRPVVTVGGELTLEALDLSGGSSNGFYRAPVQLVANGGVLIIDDFGRQRCSPTALLNRWIVPLESQVDHLLLPSGQAVEVPFMVMMVFATNLKPAELLDEAFLRRIHYKVLLPNPTAGEFTQIFANCCREQAIPNDPGIVHYVLDQIYRPRGITMRGCQPRDLIDHAMAMAQYLDQPRRLTPELLDAACANYFIDDAAIQ